VGGVTSIFGYWVKYKVGGVNWESSRVSGKWFQVFIIKL
jgi:hypothetical protein